MFCFKKISESLLYKKALEGCFRGFNSKREIVCVNDTSIHLYEVNPQGITLITKFDLNCTLLDCALFSNSETANGIHLTSLLVTTISDSLIMLEFNRSADRFEIVGQFCFAHLNKSLPSICQIGRNLSVLGSKNQTIVMAAYMQNIVVLEYQGVFIQKQVIKIKGQVFHKIIPYQDHKEQYFQVLSSELIQREQLKIRVIKVDVSSEKSDQDNQSVLAHIPILKNLNKEIEVPLDFVTYADSDGNLNYLVLTSLQIINIKLDKMSNKQSHDVMQSLFKEGSQKVQPLSLKVCQSNIFAVFNDGRCIQLIKDTKPTALDGFSFGVDKNYIETFSPNDKFNFWVTISDQSIQVGKQENSSFLVQSNIPLFSSIVSSAIDPQTGNIYSIINGNKSHLRLITDGFSAQDLRIHCRNFVNDAKTVFWRQDYQNSSSQNPCQFAIVSSLTESFVFRNQLNSGQKTLMEMKFQPINEVYGFIKEREVVIGVAYFNNKILLVLPNRMVVIDDESKLLISEYNMKNEKDQIVKCSILQNKFVFVLTKSNSILAFQMEFIHLGQLDTSQLPLEDSQISALSSYVSQNINYLCIGYYNRSFSTITWKVSEENKSRIAIESQSIRKLPETVHDILFYSNQQTQGILLSLRNGVIYDVIQTDYSKSKSEQKEQVVMLNLQNRDQCKIFKINGTIYLQSSHTIYQYCQQESKRQALQIILNEYTIWKDSNRIKGIFPLSLDCIVIIASENIYTAKFPSNKVKNHYETKQVSIPLSFRSETALKQTSTSLFASQAGFKRIIYYSPLDLFVIIDQEGRLYLVNRIGFIQQILTDVQKLNIVVASIKEIKIKNKIVLSVITKNRGAILFTIQPTSIGPSAVSKESGKREIYQLDIIQILDPFFQYDENAKEAIDISFMPLFGLLLLSGASSIVCFTLAETFDSAKEEKVLSFKEIHSHKHEVGGRIVCIDSCKNLLLVGDASESILVYNLSYKLEGKKHFLSFELEKTEFNQRPLKESVFLGDSKVLGIDKYGELFCSVLDQSAFYDANYNLHNFSQLNLREAGQILLYKGSSDLSNDPSLPTETLLICGIGGSVFQVQFCDLLFAFETESYNQYIFLIEEQLRHLKSCRVSQNKSSIDIQRATKRLGNSQRVVDVSLFESLVDSDYEQILRDLQLSIRNKEEASKVKLSEIKALIKMLIEPFEHRSPNKNSIIQS